MAAAAAFRLSGRNQEADYGTPRYNTSFVVAILKPVGLYILGTRLKKGFEMVQDPSIESLDSQLTPPGGSWAEDALGAVIAGRVRESRQECGWTVGELAERSGLSKSMLSKIENAQTSPSLVTLMRLSRILSVPMTSLFRGLDEEHDVLHIKAGTGIEVQHRGSEQGHRYELLGRMRAPHDRFEPLLVTLTERQDTFPLFQHGGTELIYMLRGTMEYSYGNSYYHLETGDALQFVGEVTHGPARLIEVPVQFLTVKTIQPSS